MAQQFNNDDDSSSSNIEMLNRIASLSASAARSLSHHRAYHEHGDAKGGNGLLGRHHANQHRAINKHGDLVPRRRTRNGYKQRGGSASSSSNRLNWADGEKGGGGRHKDRLFGTPNSTEVLTQIGSVAYLPCVVLPMGAGVVCTKNVLYNFENTLMNSSEKGLVVNTENEIFGSH